MPCRSLAVLALAAVPAIACGQLAAARPDGRVDYAVSGGASVVSGTTASAASVHFGGEAALATGNSQWRLGARALWTRTAGETAVENVIVVLVQESRHRWGATTWFRERLSLSPGLRAGDPMRGSIDTGLAIALTRLLHLDIGVTQHYDRSARPETRVVTGIAVKFD